VRDAHTVRPARCESAGPAAAPLTHTILARRPGRAGHYPGNWPGSFCEDFHTSLPELWRGASLAGRVWTYSANMADPHRGHRGFPSTETSPEQAPVPPLFQAAVAGIEAVRLRPELDLDPLPAPRRLAAYSHAVSVGVADSEGDETSSGRFVALYEPDGHDEWHGVYRCVTLAQADLEPEIAEDPLLPDVVWSWLTEAMERHGASHAVLGGTVSRCASVSFGELAQRPASTSVELRASWTPHAPPGGWTPDSAHAAFEAHFHAWVDMLAAAAGLPPLVAGVTMLPGKR
jgi:DUF3000 family protein